MHEESDTDKEGQYRKRHILCKVEEKIEILQDSDNPRLNYKAGDLLCVLLRKYRKYDTLFIRC